MDPLFLELRKARENLGMTRKQLAKKLRYHHVQIARWELGDSPPTWFGIKLWAQTVNRQILVADTQAG
ncbi:multiprotein-bridging factor 1 family protein, partial [Bacillus anthracis]|uniref:helix-turn-helix domain-containing protein n=1 Tax=Bacillus anthracis TaxID=1392 RepID=UPI003904B94B